MYKTEVLGPTEIKRAAEWVRKGELVAFPTETVYGLGAALFIPKAIESVFRAKGRPSDNPLIVHVQSVDQVKEIACDIPAAFYRLTEAFFPGPLTVILKKQPSVPSIVSGGLNSVAIRMPSHSLALELIKSVGQPLVGPSANLSGKPSATQVEHVLNDFNGKIPAIIDGGHCSLGIESTVIGLLGAIPTLFRPGKITKASIEQVLGCEVQVFTSSSGGPALSPGMKYRHYAPLADVKVFYSLIELQHYLKEQGDDKARMVLTPTALEFSIFNATSYSLLASEFYSLLRRADEKGIHEILIFCNEEVLKEDGLMNRILRSAGKYT